MRRAAPTWRIVRAVGRFAALLCAFGTMAFVALPAYVIGQSKARAHELGASLDVSQAKLGFGHLLLLGVSATFADAPGVTIQISEVDLPTFGGPPQRAMVRDARVVLEGDPAFLKGKAEEWISRHGAEARKGSIVTWVLENAQITWKNPLPGGYELDVLAVTGEIVSRDGHPESHLRTPHVVLQTPSGEAGPLRVSWDQTDDASEVRVDFSSPVQPQGNLHPSGAFAVWKGKGGATQAFDLTIPKTRLSTLGIPPKLLALTRNSLEVAAKVHLEENTKPDLPLKADATFQAYNVNLSSSPPIMVNISLELHAGVSASKGILLRDSFLALGALKAPLSGTWAVTTDGAVRLDVGWKAGPISCAAFADSPRHANLSANGDPLDLRGIGDELLKFAKATGIAQIRGDITMTGSFLFDSRDIERTRFSFQPKSTCDLVLFGTNLGTD